MSFFADANAVPFAAISDLHIRYPNDRADKALEAFFSHPKVRSAEVIFLLGDIFDLMIGNHERYFTLYPRFWELVDHSLASGQTIYYAEGNHDFHLDKLFSSFFSKRIGLEKNFKLIRYSETIEYEGLRLRIGHGDDYDHENKGYQRLRLLLKSQLFNWIANNLVSFPLLHKIGMKASQKSRQRGQKIFNEALTKAKFRLGVQALSEPTTDVYLGGHSHVQDRFEWDDKLYINTGDPKISSQFILGDANAIDFCSLL